MKVTASPVSPTVRARPGPDRDPNRFLDEHRGYVDALGAAGVNVTTLVGLDEFPDAVFIEDAALCLWPIAVQLRPGATSRAGEAAVLHPDLVDHFEHVLTVDDGHIDGGDILVTDHEAIVGTSSRTDRAGIAALERLFWSHDHVVRAVHTPPEVLHLKTDCAVIDSDITYTTARLAASGCFDGYRVITAPRAKRQPPISFA